MSYNYRLYILYYSFSVYDKTPSAPRHDSKNVSLSQHPISWSKIYNISIYYVKKLFTMQAHVQKVKNNEIMSG